jgi:hypothetical protein
MAISVAHTDEDKAELLFDAMVSWGVVKCSTPEDEQAKLDPVVTKACIRNWVTKELEIIPNVPILLLGEKLKNLRNIAREIDSRTGYLSHPSRPWYNYEDAKKKLQNYLRTSTC